MDFEERYGRFGEEDDFDRAFWAKQPREVVFDAAYGMIKDYLLLRDCRADEPRLQRTVESFRRV
ncbi:MAG: hypothetical protein U5K81_05030 [Trueperaceae bacterium]|nr:hypothetical protein [Trueperaceae bacterium]